jgi:hypothetical protein
MEWCCAKAKQSNLIDLDENLFFIHGYDGLDDEYIEICPFCGKALKELLT